MILAGAAAGGLVGCNSSGSSSARTSPASAVVRHKFGSTAVPADVRRVVTVGWNDQDFVLPFGIVPVGVRGWFDNYDRLPWVQRSTAGRPLPVVSTDEIDFEQIAAARPELILAIYETVDQATYRRLSEIAPTVVQPAGRRDEETPWDAQLLITGQALGREDRAHALIKDVQTAVDRAKTEHPEFVGAVLVEDYGPENGGHYLIGKGDPRRALVDALGFATQQQKGELSEEKLSILDRDILFVLGATESQMLRSKLFARLQVVKQGRTLYTSFESDLAAALSYSGPDALLYAVDALVPRLAAALKRRS
ncbi:iron complex transport system substrate-binding protein [Microlunatus soli]|uniref:Iron complex transport system substrate-binding protein n=2 Tax=Microlunatus soli TaxID=630515 RepID=A0A1H1W8I5_9ACTN|nr:iron complex transport system substrate-binding protein [Microlunatus soli]